MTAKVGSSTCSLKGCSFSAWRVCDHALLFSLRVLKPWTFSVWTMKDFEGICR